MRQINLFPLSLLVCTLAFTTTRVGAQEAHGGQPAPGAKQSVVDLDEQVAYQRAFEAVLWAMPASAIYRFRVGLLAQPGMADNVITAFSGPLHTFHELITPNQVTPYIGALADLRNGPVVLELQPKPPREFSTVRSSMRGRRPSPTSVRREWTKARAVNTCFFHPTIRRRFRPVTWWFGLATTRSWSRCARFL